MQYSCVISILISLQKSKIIWPFSLIHTADQLAVLNRAGNIFHAGKIFRTGNPSQTGNPRMRPPGLRNPPARFLPTPLAFP